jgi:hypothetical protein
MSIIAGVGCMRIYRPTYALAITSCEMKIRIYFGQTKRTLKELVYAKRRAYVFENLGTISLVIDSSLTRCSGCLRRSLLVHSYIARIHLPWLLSFNIKKLKVHN